MYGIFTKMGPGENPSPLDTFVQLKKRNPNIWCVKIGGKKESIFNGNLHVDWYIMYNIGQYKNYLKTWGF